MKVLLVGGGETGAEILKQLSKNPRIKVILSDLREKPPVVEMGLARKVDILGNITPMNIRAVIKKHKPDLIIIALSPEDIALEKVPSGDILTSQLKNEIADVSEVPVLII